MADQFSTGAAVVSMAAGASLTAVLEQASAGAPLWVSGTTYAIG